MTPSPTIAPPGAAGSTGSTDSTVRVELPELSQLGAIDDARLIEVMRAWAEARRVVDAGLARLSGEVKSRSSLELGYDGLAQRTGARTADAFVSALTGTSGNEARDMVAVGAMLSNPTPWMAEVATLVGSGQLSVGAAAAIEKGIGTPSADVAADDLIDVAHAVAMEAQTMPPEKVARLARELRDELDAGGVADREAALRARRGLRLFPLANGNTRISGEADPESAAILKGALDAITSPRLGGLRFIDSTEMARAQATVDDPRTTPQLALDALVEMVRIAIAADDGRIFGVRKPSVRVHVALADLDRRGVDTFGQPLDGTIGFAHIEGETAAISIETAERRMCADGYVPILFDDDGCALKHGRAKRLHTEKQRIALAAMWGGCAVDGCDRPPSWTEAHHMNEWVRDHGETDVATGVLLCRHHHMLLHNNHWRIIRRGPGLDFEMQPPPGGRVTHPIRLLSKNPIRRRT